MTKTLSIVALLALSGCSPARDYEPANREGKLKDTSTGQIEVILLDDGTRCAVYAGYKNGGIDCDWSTRDVE
jgi:hypothetical protein